MKKVFSPDIFKIIFFVVSVLGVMPFLSWEITPFLKIFHIYALGVLILDVLGEKRILHNKGRILLFVFAFVYFITLLNNNSLWNLSGISNFGYLLITLGIVYSYGKDSDRYNWIGANIVCALITISNVAGIVMFFEKTHIYYEGRGYLGMFPFENRLCGMFGNPNVLGMICLIGVSLGAILFFQSKNTRIKGLYVIGIVVSFVALLLSNSRTQIYSTIFIVAVYWALQMLKHEVNLKTLTKACMVGLIVIVIGFFGCKFLQQGLSLLDVNYDYYHAVIDAENQNTEQVVNTEQITQNSEKDNQEKHLDETNEQTIGRHDSGLNGRWALWMTGWRLFLAKPLFGHGLDNHEYSLFQLGLPGLPVKGNLHNAYIDLIVACGLFGFLCFVVFIYIMLKDTISITKKATGARQNQIMLIIAILAGFMLDGLVDSTLIASVYPTAIAFWYIMSYLANIIEFSREKVNRIRVVHFVSKMDRAGQETFIMNLYRKVDKDSIHFDFLCTDASKGDYDDEIRELGGNIYYVRPITIKGPLKQLEKFWALFNALRKIEGEFIFHVHTHHAMDAVNNALAAKLAGVRIIVIHSHNTSALYHLKAHAFFKKILSLLKIHRFACSNAAGEWMFGTDNFHVLHNGLDMDIFRFSQELRESIRDELEWDGKKIIGHIGRFNAQKNHEFIVDVFEEIHNEMNEAHLVLVGKGELEEEIRDKIKRKGLQDAITFLGVRNDAYRLYQGMDLFLFPSLFEGLPVVLVEAQASDLSCIISDTISKESILTENVIVEKLDSNAKLWAKKCVDILEKKNKREDRTIEIRKAQYDISDLAKKLKKYYYQEG